MSSVDTLDIIRRIDQEIEMHCQTRQRAASNPNLLSSVASFLVANSPYGSTRAVQQQHLAVKVNRRDCIYLVTSNHYDITDLERSTSEVHFSSTSTELIRLMHIRTRTHTHAFLVSCFRRLAKYLLFAIGERD